MDQFSAATQDRVTVMRDFACFQAAPEDDFGEVVSMFRYAATLVLDESLSGAVCTIEDTGTSFGSSLYWGVRVLSEAWTGSEKRLALVCAVPGSINERLFEQAVGDNWDARARVFRELREAVAWVTGRPAELMLPEREPQIR
jgi:hypothetical protein